MENTEICYLNMQIDISGVWSEVTSTYLPSFFYTLLYTLTVCIYAVFQIYNIANTNDCFPITAHPEVLFLLNPQHFLMQNFIYEK